MLPTSIAGSTVSTSPLRVKPSRELHVLALASATSTLAAKSSPSTISSSPAAHGAMYSWAPTPPIIPTSPSTR